MLNPYTLSTTPSYKLSFRFKQIVIKYFRIILVKTFESQILITYSHVSQEILFVKYVCKRPLHIAFYVIITPSRLY